MKEVRAIGLAGSAPLYPLNMVIHMTVGNTMPVAVLTFDVKCDYVKNWTDYILSEVTVTQAQYTQVVAAANEEILEATIVNGPFGNIRYRCLVAPTSDLPNLDALRTLDQNELDQSLMTITLQLVNLSAEAMSMGYVGGVYNNMTMTDVIRAGANEVAGNLDISHPIDSIEVVETDNPKETKQLIVPSKTKWLHLQKFLQKECGGVYSGGINQYLYHYKGKSKLRIYPPTKSDWGKTEETKRLVLWDMFDSAMLYKDRTYNLYPEGSEQVHCIVSRQVVSSETTEGRETVRSTGFRQVSPKDMMEGYATVTPKSVSTNKERVDVNAQVGTRADGLNRFTPGSETITSNILDTLSSVRVNKGKTYRFNWNNSNPQLLYPGMPIKINSEVSGGFVERYGTLVYSYSAYTRVTGLSGAVYKAVTFLIVFVEEDTTG